MSESGGHALVDAHYQGNLVGRTPGTSFEGSDGSGRTSRAQELLQIYRFRLEHIRKHRIEILGVEELVIALSLRAADARIRGESFVGPESVAHAFWDEDNKLVGCGMSNRHGMGEENLARAMD